MSDKAWYEPGSTRTEDGDWREWERLTPEERAENERVFEQAVANTVTMTEEEFWIWLAKGGML